MYPYLHLYIYIYIYPDKNTTKFNFETSHSFGLPVPHTLPFSFCLQSPLKVPAAVQQFPPQRKKHSKNKGLSILPIQKFSKKRKK